MIKGGVVLVVQIEFFVLFQKILTKKKNFACMQKKNRQKTVQTTTTRSRDSKEKEEYLIKKNYKMEIHPFRLKPGQVRRRVFLSLCFCCRRAVLTNDICY